MARIPLLLILLLVVLGLTREPGAVAGEPPGIRWEPELEAGLARAAQEGRPVLFAINALAQERANQRLRNDLYPSVAWGASTREYVCFVANPAEHGSGAAGCGAYPGIPCASHKAVLRYVTHRFDPVSRSLISPQHIVLEPDGAVAFRKEYYTGVVGPELLARLWVGLAPELAYERAGAYRQDRVATLEDLKGARLEEAARGWLLEGDPLAAAGLLRAVDFAPDDRWRLGVIRALAATPVDQLSVVDLLADEYGARPDDAPEAALALARALLTAERERGTALLARILVHTDRSGLRSQATAAWLEDPDGGSRRSPRQLPEDERARLGEALLLAGESAPSWLPKRPPGPLEHRLRRARVLQGGDVRLHLPLEEALADGRAGRLCPSLYEAGAGDVREHAAAIRALLRERPERRVRYAAAIALMGAGLDEGGRVAGTVWEAVGDAVEGPEARQEAVRRLGEDPGWNEAVWVEAAAKAARGES